MKSNNFFRIALSVFVSFVFVFAVTYAATTISTNISTGGTLTVDTTSTLTGAVATGAAATIGTDLTVTSGARVGTGSLGGHITALADDSLLIEGQSEFDGISWFDGSLRASTTLMATGAATLYSTLDVTGLTTLANASTTNISASNALWVGGNATTTSAGAITANGLATFLGGATTTTLTLLNGEIISNGTNGVIQLDGIASTTSITLLNGETITNATDGTIALTGALTVSGVSTFTGLGTLLGGATTTILTLLNGEQITNATDGVIQLDGIASTTSITLLNGETITNATNGVVAIGGASDTLKILGTASTSALIVGDEPAAPTINGMVFGYCSFGDVNITASTTEGFASCTTVPAGALLANDRVFVQATSSFQSMYVITAASTTGVSTIQLRILNTGLGGADGTLEGTSINFWAVR